MKAIKISKKSEKIQVLLVASFGLFVFSMYLIIENTFINVIDRLESVETFQNKLPTDHLPFAAVQVSISNEKVDWHDWNMIAYEKTRRGPGEQGEAVKLKSPKERLQNRRLANFQGLSALVSDKISVNRSIPDTRHEKCRSIKYFKSLPSTSIIIVYHNEYFSLLLRTIHSIYNRTPHRLLHEVLLVNDASTKEELYERLESYVGENFDQRVKIVNLEERKGLIVARMEGARRATGEVLVFLDAHVEVNVNWLPPLLEPIVIDPKICTVPVNDDVNTDTFEYISGVPTRGVFDWRFLYQPLPQLPEYLAEPEKPAPTPIMLGCSFAIRRDYFFHIGGYDEKLIIWNGENYELSLKLWLCGGSLFEIPCSRVSHLFRKRYSWRISPAGEDFSVFTVKNFKRIAEVWLDDYKKYLYRINPNMYETIDVGDLTREKQIREKLNCKPFQYMLDVVMPDMLVRFPYEERGVFAKGSIQSEANKKLCIDTFDKPNGEQIGLSACSKNLTEPKKFQNFTLNWFRQIVESSRVEDCLDTAGPSLWQCHFEFSNQFWFYNIKTHQLMNKPYNCLSANLIKKTLEMQTCHENDLNQKWTWSFLNISAINNWKTFGFKISDDLIKEFKF